VAFVSKKINPVFQKKWNRRCLGRSAIPGKVTGWELNDHSQKTLVNDTSVIYIQA